MGGGEGGADSQNTPYKMWPNRRSPRLLLLDSKALWDHSITVNIPQRAGQPPLETNTVPITVGQSSEDAVLHV